MRLRAYGHCSITMGKIITIFLILVGLLSVALSARAEEVFLFTDDLSSKADIDKSRTSTKFASGQAYTADESVSSSIESEVISNVSKAIISARLDAYVFVPSGTRIVYYLTNNDGSNWTQVNLGYTYTLSSSGNELKWKAIITRESPFVPSASIDSVTITYTEGDSRVSSSPSSLTGGSSSGNRVSGVVSYGNGGDLTSFVCDALGSVGFGCGRPDKKQSPTRSQLGDQLAAIKPSSSVGQRQVNTGSSSSSTDSKQASSLQAAIANVTVKRTASDDQVILVKIPAKDSVRPTLGLKTNDAIFEIIKGQKHFIPTVDIFFDYGFNLNSIQEVTHKDLEQFPRVSLADVYDDGKKTYYITEGYMIRMIPDKKVFESYGDREDDVITISKKEFNFYPRNQYVFLEGYQNRDVFQIVGNDTKRFVTPQIVNKLGIKREKIAPINQVQLDAYRTGQPIIF